ncbi:hypothetical protein K440DRAFT_669882 [Wilcoxina mikolae CBS 423.85]|nr:hypothetical protein K440DRAFT_669882 [Wilcoxina mikolae CBS 423.85]
MNNESEERLDDFYCKVNLVPKEKYDAIYEKLDYCDPARVQEMTLLILTSLNLTKPPSSHDALINTVDYVLTLIQVITDRAMKYNQRQSAVSALDTLYDYFSNAATAQKESELQKYVAVLVDPRLEQEACTKTVNQCSALDIIWYSWAAAFLALGATLGELYEDYWEAVKREKTLRSALKQLKLGHEVIGLTKEETQKEIEDYTTWMEQVRDELYGLRYARWECIHSIKLTQQAYECAMQSYAPAIEAYKRLQHSLSANGGSMDFFKPVPPTVPLEFNHKLKDHTKSWFQAKERGIAEREGKRSQSQSSSINSSSSSRRIDIPGPTIIVTDENGKDFKFRKSLPLEDQHEVLEWEKKSRFTGSGARIRMITPKQSEESHFERIPSPSVSLREFLAVDENNDKKYGPRDKEAYLEPVRLPTPPVYSTLLEEMFGHEINMEDDSYTSQESQEWLEGYLIPRPESRCGQYAPVDQSMDNLFPAVSEPQPLFGPDGEILMEDFRSVTSLNSTESGRFSPQALGTVAKAVGRKIRQVFSGGRTHPPDIEMYDSSDTSYASRAGDSDHEDLRSTGVWGGGSGGDPDHDPGDYDEHENDKSKEFGNGNEASESTEEDPIEDAENGFESTDEGAHPDLYSYNTACSCWAHRCMETIIDTLTDNITQLFEDMKIGSRNSLQSETLSKCQLEPLQKQRWDIRSNIPLLQGEVPKLPWHVRHPEKKPLRILDRRLGEDDSYGYLTREHYIYRLVEWSRDSLCSLENAAKYAIILRASQGRFNEVTDNIEDEGPATAAEIAAAVEWLSKEFPEGSLIGCHQLIRPRVIQLHSGLFYSIEKGVQEGKGVAHIIWLIFHTISHEFAHYLVANAKVCHPDSRLGCHCLNGEEGELGDLMEFLLYGARASWDCKNPDLDQPIKMDCSGGFWWDENHQKQYTTLSPQRAVDFIKNTPKIRRLGSTQWVALSKNPMSGRSPSEDLKIPRSGSPEFLKTYQVIPQEEEIPDVDKLYARRDIIDERDRKMIRFLRDYKKSTATDNLNGLGAGKRHISREDIPTPVGYPEILYWYHIAFFYPVPIYLLLAVSLLVLEPPQIDPYERLSIPVIALGLIMALVYNAFCFLPLRRTMLWFCPLSME